MKRMLVTVLAVGCLVSLTWLGVSLLAGSKAVASSTPGQRWEYMVVGIVKTQIWDMTLESGTFGKAGGMGFAYEAYVAQRPLDAAGIAGWELVTVVGVLGGDQEFIFKRPLL